MFVVVVVIRLRANSDASKPHLYPCIVTDLVPGVLLQLRVGSSGLLLSESVPADIGM